MKSNEGKDGSSVELTTYRVAYVSRSVPWAGPKIILVNAINTAWIYDNWQKIINNTDSEIAAIRKPVQ